MSDSLTETKFQLRQQCRKLRASLGEETRASQSVCEALERWPIFQQSSCILNYMPIKSEVDLTPLLTGHPEKYWLLPRILPEEEHRMIFHPYDAERLVRPRPRPGIRPSRLAAGLRGRILRPVPQGFFWREHRHCFSSVVARRYPAWFVRCADAVGRHRKGIHRYGLPFSGGIIIPP
jgi:hypothetical protein